MSACNYRKTTCNKIPNPGSAGTGFQETEILDPGGLKSARKVGRATGTGNWPGGCASKPLARMTTAGGCLLVLLVLVGCSDAATFR